MTHEKTVLTLSLERILNCAIQNLEVLQDQENLAENLQDRIAINLGDIAAVKKPLLALWDAERNRIYARKLAMGGNA